MKTVNQQIVKQIEYVAEELQITKRQAAEAVRANFVNDGLHDSVKQVDKYIELLK